MTINNTPDVNFSNITVDEILTEMINVYEETYYQEAGIKKTLSVGDPERIQMQTMALLIYQAYESINYSAKMNLLKYAKEDFIDNIGARIGQERSDATSAITTVRFTLSEVQANAISIPQGTRVSTGNNLFFASTEYKEIASGETYIDIECECMTTGIIGNGLTSGQIKILVDPIPYIQSVENIDISQGGTDIESDDSLREKILLKPESFSVAGPSGAYEYFTKEYSSSIKDVKVSSPTPGNVDIRIILDDGEIPSTTLLDGLGAYLGDKKRRPLTDNITVQAPAIVNYSVDITYFIRSSDESNVSTIQAKVNEAVNEYVLWQKTKIGRDISPTELISKVIQAGAKRLEVTSPTYASIDNTQIAIDGSINIVYGGIEDE